MDVREVCICVLRPPNTLSHVPLPRGVGPAARGRPAARRRDATRPDGSEVNQNSLSTI